jgi:hypothetical protein
MSRDRDTQSRKQQRKVPAVPRRVTSGDVEGDRAEEDPAAHGKDAR